MGHWAWAKNLLLVESDADIDELNNLFVGDDQILVEYTEGMREDDNLALTFVHGNQEGCKWQSGNCIKYASKATRLRYGLAKGNPRREYMPFTINSFAPVKPGDALSARQYMISGSYTASNILPRQWVNEAEYTLNEMKSGEDGSTGTDIQLYKSNDGLAFDFTIGTQTCMGGTLWCNGSSIPKFETKAFFNIKCGDSSYVGSDLYFFSAEDESDVIRSYSTCIDGKRAKWQLLGFFNESCLPLSVKYDSLFCKSVTSDLPSTFASDLPSTLSPTKAPTSFPSNAPTISTSSPTKVPTLFPSNAPTISTSSPTKSPTRSSTSFPTLAPIILPSCEDDKGFKYKKRSCKGKKKKNKKRCKIRNHFSCKQIKKKKKCKNWMKSGIEVKEFCKKSCRNCPLPTTAP